MYTLSEALKEKTEQSLRFEFASDLLRETKSIPFAVKMSKLPEDVVRRIAADIEKSNNE